jgi:hypothetical protein
VSNKPQVGERYEIDGRTVQITAVTAGYVYGVRLTKAGKFIKRSRPDFNCNLKAWEGLGAMLTVEQVIAIAEGHIGEGAMVGSAKLALADAKRLLERGEIDAAYTRALVSLAYSVGAFHSDYIRANWAAVEAGRRV